MPNDPQTTPDPEHIKVVAVPCDFAALCPACDGGLFVELKEQDDGGFECEPEDIFMECDCGQLIEVTGRWRNLP